MTRHPCPARLPAQRQPRGRQRRRLPDRHAGAGAAAAGAEAAGRARRAQHRRLRLGLPRLAAGHGRPAAVEGEEVPRRRPHRVPARHQRRPGRHRLPGRAARGAGPAAHRRWRVCDVVRQGPGRGPLGRRAQARQRLRHAARRAACWWCAATTTAASPAARRTRATRRCRPGACPWCTRPTWPSTWSSACTAGRSRRFSGAWVGFKAISEVVESGMTVDLDAVPLDFEHAVDFQAPSQGPAHPRGRPAVAGTGVAPGAQARRGARLRQGQQHRQAHRHQPAPPRWASSPWARRTTTSWRCCAGSTWTPTRWPPPACASTRWAWCSRWSRRASSSSAAT